MSSFAPGSAVAWRWEACWEVGATRHLRITTARIQRRAVRRRRLRSLCVSRRNPRRLRWRRHLRRRHRHSTRLGCRMGSRRCRHLHPRRHRHRRRRHRRRHHLRLPCHSRLRIFRVRRHRRPRRRVRRGPPTSLRAVQTASESKEGRASVRMASGTPWASWMGRSATIKGLLALEALRGSVRPTRAYGRTGASHARRRYHHLRRRAPTGPAWGMVEHGP